MEYSEILIVSSFSPGYPEREIISICEASAPGPLATIGGILLYANGSFMQLIEGDTQSVQVAYENVRTAAWHFDIHILLSEKIEARRCEGWGFSHVPLGKSIDTLSQSSPHYFPFKKREIKQRVKKGDARYVLKTFIDTNR